MKQKSYKKLIASACALVLVGTTAITAAAAVIGDANNDGKCDSNDITTVGNFILGRSADCSVNADMNNDGVINSADMCLVRKEALFPSTPVSDIKDFGTAPHSPVTMFEDFRDGSSEYFIASDGWENGDPFDCGWYESNTTLDKGYLTLTIDKDHSGKYNYSGAEYRTNDFYHYGYYECSMQAIKNDGVVSSFFTYTGPSDDNPWDEIDIEILGKDTTKVQLNYYKDGQGGHEFMYDLGFDASEGFHTYGFDWQPDHITWYVDGKEAHTMWGNMPSTPGKIMMNTWPGRGVDEWLNRYNGNTPLTARYQWVTYSSSVAPPVEQPTDPVTPSGSIKDYGTAPKLPATMYSNFRENSAGDFFASDGWTNGDPFDCYWTENNAYVKDGMLTLKIDKGLNNGKGTYTGGEFRTNDFYSYGYFETSMQAIKNDGVVSSFFTYTGPSDDNPWDEIDIEILGKDTTKVQFNYYTNGKGDHEYMYDLGFDASEGYHTYGFDWQPTYIAWYVDGKEVYRATQNIPSTPGKIMMNAWPGVGVDEWLKHFNGNVPLEAHYQWVTYQKSESSGNNGGNNNGNSNMTQSGIVDYGTAPVTTSDMYSNFRENSAGDFFASDGWTNGNPFDCYWTKNNAYINNGMLTLKIDRGLNNGKGNYTGGEFRTNNFYSYGYYETSMQAIKNNGVVSSFFTYTGESDGNPWDEIDIEILGKDTTKVQFNYYTNGKGDHEYMYDLGFDASEGYHTYGFDWQPDHITWYVDGKEAHTMWGDVPKTPGKIMMNAWPGTGVDEWLAHYDGRTPLEAHYQWVTYRKQK